MRQTLSIFLALLAMSLAGCRSGPANGGGQQALVAPAVRFQRLWYERDVDWSRYNKIWVAPVSTDFASQMAWWSTLSTHEVQSRDAALEQMGVTFRAEVVKAFRRSSLEISGERGGVNVLVVELALVELVPARSWLEARGGRAVRLGRQGSLALEGRLRDGRTGDVLAMFADRQGEPPEPSSGRERHWWGHPRSTLSRWARQLVVIANRRARSLVDDVWPFTLRSW